MRLPSYDAVLFDFDGVLADTEPVHFACWRDVLAPLGIHVDWESYQGCIGLSERDTVEYFGRLADPAVPLEAIWPHYPTKKQLFRNRVMAAPPITAPTVELICSLSNIAVVSSSATSEVRPMLEQAGIIDRFGALVFAEDVPRHKPAPEPYLLAAERLNAKRPLVVEDSDTGARSGRAAGFDVLLVRSPADVPSAVRSKIPLDI
jgi:HAD superfamily hydrolase (TIGR01509 family)